MNSHTAPRRILIVEDEDHIARGLIFNLEQEGYAVHHVENGRDAFDLLDREHFDLLVLDLMLPDISGLEICRHVHEYFPDILILMLTALGTDKDRIAGLSQGADDYLPKPFNLDEFLLRVKALLRRAPSSAGKPSPRFYRFGDNSIDLEQGLAHTPRGDFDLTDLEIKMLKVLIRKAGQVVSRAELLQEVWGVTPDTETRTLDNFVVRLRKYFEKKPARPVHIQTVRGRGYRFVRNQG
ncbi:MAG TPA: response regulator transcription factor [Geoalkalibacter subterraneus]|uniref:Response regulator transcription factor n=1 Tax=Geoalkalibacter subterraneus TaxID=483547 RepID=A0A831PNL9_9BACT|nr:response regulator transcription factor [Geoalkalibacter subterraneus]